MLGWVCPAGADPDWSSADDFDIDGEGGRGVAATGYSNCLSAELGASEGCGGGGGV